MWKVMFDLDYCIDEGGAGFGVRVRVQMVT
jgi:hypothetical protein